MKKNKLAIPAKSLSQKKREAVLKGGKTQDVYNKYPKGGHAADVYREEALKEKGIIRGDFAKQAIKKINLLTTKVKSTNAMVKIGKMDEGTYFLCFERTFKPGILDLVHSTVLLDRTKTKIKTSVMLSEEAVYALAGLCIKILSEIEKKKKSAAIREVAFKNKKTIHGQGAITVSRKKGK